MQSTIPEKFFRVFFNAFVLLMPIMILPYGMYDISRYVLFLIISSLILVIFFLQLLQSRSIINVKPIFIFLFLGVLSTVFSVNKFVAIFGTYKNREGLITLFLYLIIFFSVITFVKSKRQLLEISLCLSIGLFLNNLFGIYEMLFNSFGLGFKLGPRIMTTFGDPNILGGFSMISLPLILYTIRLTENLKIKLFSVINALLTLIVIIFSGSRSALMGLIFSLVFFAVYLRKINFKTLILMFLVPLIVSVNPFLYSRLRVSVFIVEIINRIVIIKGSFKYLVVNPLLGTGPDTLRLFTGNYGGFGGAHSGVINLVQNLGLMGLVSVLFIFIYVLIKGFQLIGKSNEISTIPYMFSIISLVIFSSSNYTVSELNIFLWINMALILCLNKMEMNSFRSIKVPKLNFLLPLVSIACFLLMFLALRIPLGGVYWRQGLIYEESDKYTEALEKFKLAVKMVPDDEIYLWSYGSLSLNLAKNGYPSYLSLAQDSFSQIDEIIRPGDPIIQQKLEEIKTLSK